MKFSMRTYEHPPHLRPHCLTDCQDHNLNGPLFLKALFTSKKFIMFGFSHPSVMGDAAHGYYVNFFCN